MSQGINSAYGLQPVESMIGNGGTQKVQAYKIYASPDGATTQPNSIFNGDPVKFSGTAGNYALRGGTIVPCYDILAAVDTATSVATTAVITDPFLGVFISCQYVDVNGTAITSNMWPGGTKVLPGSEIIALVNDDPMAIFKVQVSSSTADLATTIFLNKNIGQNAKLSIGQTAVFNANPLNLADNAFIGKKLSAYYLDNTTAGTGTAGDRPGYDVKIVRIAPSPFNKNTDLANNSVTAGIDMRFIDVYVKFVRHIYGSSSLGVPTNA